MRARMYEPRTGRFIQLDPIYSRRASCHFVYSLNIPLTFVDPLGFQEKKPSSIQYYNNPNGSTTVTLYVDSTKDSNYDTTTTAFDRDNDGFYESTIHSQITASSSYTYTINRSVPTREGWTSLWTINRVDNKDPLESIRISATEQRVGDTIKHNYLVEYQGYTFSWGAESSAGSAGERAWRLGNLGAKEKELLKEAKNRYNALKSGITIEESSGPTSFKEPNPDHTFYVGSGLNDIGDILVSENVISSADNPWASSVDSPAPTLPKRIKTQDE